MHSSVTMKILLPFLLLAWGVGGPASAQPLPQVDDPAAKQLRLSQDLLERYQREQSLIKPKTGEPEITLPDRSAGAAPSDVKSIPVTRFEVDTSALLSAEEVDRALAAYRGRDVSLKELFDAVAKINELYDAKGARTSRAILPAQDIKDGVVKIRLVEARIGVIRISGTPDPQIGFVQERLRQRSGELLSVDGLEQDLIRFNTLYQAQLRASVTAGAEVGKTDLTIEVKEPKRHNFTTFLDNAGGDSVGESRYGANYSGNGLLNLGDSLQLSTSGTQGSRSYGISYSTPLNRDDLRLDLSLSQARIKVVNGPFVPLEITGLSRDFTVGLTQPFAVSLTGQWAAYARLSLKNSVSLFGGVTQQERDLHVFSLGVRGEARRDPVAWSIDNSMNWSAKGFGSDAQFAYYRGNASRIDRLSPRVQLLTRASVQHSFDRVLPSGEQFQAGGTSTVRGFSEGLLSGRNGFALSAELRAVAFAPSPDMRADTSPMVQVLGFIDHGAALPYRPGQGNSHDDYLTSAGVGFIIDFGSRVTTRVTAAWPLDRNPAERLQHSPRVLAALNISWY
jgi:hemolysin activation/secretion protein